MKTTTLQVRGMHCASCVAHLERSLGRVPGVSGVVVNLATGEARVQADGDVGGDRLRQAVEEAGYEAELPAGPHPDHGHAHSHASGHEHGAGGSAAEAAFWGRRA